MLYNPQLHHRRSIRFKGYDYAQSGLYFITICCHEKNHRFGEIIDQLFPVSSNGNNQEVDNPIPSNEIFPVIVQMKLNEFGIVAYNEWMKLPQRFPNIELDVFQIMPNHVHGVILLNEIVTPKIIPPDKTSAASISEIIGAYKSLVTNGCLELFKSQNITMGKFWQRNYYEHIIRNEKSYATISDYIENNPAKWKEDKFYSK
jgi:REP element-mobilizing transposase RayT